MLNFDRASKRKLGPMRYRGIIQHLFPIILFIFFGMTGISSKNVDEIMYHHMGVDFCHAKRFTKLLVEGDSQVIINMI